jgi:hypothetical protein
VRARPSSDLARQSAKCCSPGARLLPRLAACCAHAQRSILV